MNIIWDEKKATGNFKKHRGVSFEEASTCLLDPMALVVEVLTPKVNSALYSLA
jgi:uncharacterized DUF497 family protein